MSKTSVVTEDYKEKYGFSDPIDSYAVQGVKGLSEKVVQEIVRDSRRASLDGADQDEGAQALPEQEGPFLGS